MSAPLGQEWASDIRLVRVLVSGHDPREWAQVRDEERIEAHLCGSCRRDMAESYFGHERPLGSLRAPQLLREVR